MMTDLNPAGFKTVSVKLESCMPSLWWLVVLVLIFGAGQWHGLWGGDEPREAEIAREIYASGDWVIPHLSGRPFLEKPPLTHWGAAIVFHAAGRATETLCRIPSAFWGLVGALATAWLGTMLAGRRAGIFAAFILATSVQWIYITHLLLVDVPLAACVALTLAAFWYGYRAGGTRKTCGYCACAIAAGGAFMAKGTVGMVIPGAAIAAFLVWRKEWREMLRLFFPWGLPLLALSTLPWLYLLVKRGGREALYVFVWHNQVLRFFSPGADHSEPPWYYLPLLFEILAPWVIFLPPALIRLFKPLDRQRRGDPQRQYLLSLLIVPFVLLSAASGKRRLYLLPLMPGCAIVIAVWLVGAWHEARARWEAVWRHWGLMLVALLPLGSWAGALFLGLRCGTGIAVALAGLIVAGVAITYLFRSPEWPHPHRLEGFAVALLIFAYAAVLSPPIWSFMEQKKGYLPLKEMLERHVPTGAPLYLYMPGEREQGAVSFYRHAIAPVLQSQEELARVLGISPRNYVLIQKRIISGQLELLFLSSAEVVASADVPRRQQVLLKGKELP